MGVIQRKSGAGLRAWLLAPLLLAACAVDEETLKLAPVEGFAGLVAADEPRAALIGRDVLANGGNAADAAVAMYFTMSVTLPSRASLGGGGVCLTFDHGDLEAQVIEFLPRPTPTGATIPLGIRAMAALHARHGLNKWETLLSPAEGLARFGHPVSRAYARDLALAASRLEFTAESEGLLLGRSGKPLGEGDVLEQLELSAVLSGLRSQGAGYFYTGPFAERFARASQAAGLPLHKEELRGAVPRTQKPLRLELGTEVLYFSQPPADGGLLAGGLWQILSEVRDYAAADPAEQPHLFVEAAMRAFADQASWKPVNGGGPWDAAAVLEEEYLARLLVGYSPARHTQTKDLSPHPAGRPDEPDGAGFVVGDRWGNAVACGLTMNGLFGSGRLLDGTGILLPAAPDGASAGAMSPTLVLFANENAGDTHLAASVSGGPAAPTALVTLLLGLIAEGRPLEQTIAAPRLHHGGAPDVVWHEPAVPRPVLEGLRSRGHALAEATELGRANAFFCIEGLLDNEDGCAVASDPRGWGLASFVK